jgi:FKBP-type peptidyl-prolyl cis-trans isomerase FklB
MVPGDEYELTIPSDLAYGSRGAGASIGPNSVLIFKVELLSINGKDDL